MDAGCTVFDEHLGQLHCGCEAAVSCVCISNDWVEVVDKRLLCKLLRRHVLPGSILLAVVKHLRSEELVYLIGYCVIRVVAHIWSRLI